MLAIEAIDHVAITVSDLQEACAFYDRLFGARVHYDHVVDGVLHVRQIGIGDVVLSMHQSGNGLDLVARAPTVGAVDICFRCAGTIADALALIEKHNIELVEGPADRTTAAREASQSIYFRDMDGNLVELMCRK